MNVILESMRELEGELMTLDGNTLIPNVNIIIDTETAKNLADILRSKKVTRENQEFLFSSVSMKKEFITAFKQGQHNKGNDSDRIVVTSETHSPIRFKGYFKTYVKTIDGYGCFCRIEIGDFLFHAKDKVTKILDDVACYENVSGVIFQSNNYQVVIL